MHDIEPLIAQWRQSASTSSGLPGETLDEVESHLRDAVDALLQSGLPPQEAFEKALAQLGPAPSLSREFAKLDRLWLPARIAIGLAFVAAASAIVMGLLAASRSAAPGFGLLLAAHVFSIILGYTTIFLIGGVGICYVIQRCFTDLSPSTLQGLRRASLLFALAATFFTALGTLLGGFWATTHLGRFWGWDVKESSALAILIWLTGFLFSHRAANLRLPMLLSILGSAITLFAWFGANQLSTLHSYPTSGLSSLIMLAIALHILLFLLGLTPARCLRPSRA